VDSIDHIEAVKAIDVLFEPSVEVRHLIQLQGLYVFDLCNPLITREPQLFLFYHLIVLNPRRLKSVMSQLYPKIFDSNIHRLCHLSGPDLFEYHVRLRNYILQVLVELP
jgi:hypothetical protein